MRERHGRTGRGDCDLRSAVARIAKPQRQRPRHSSALTSLAVRPARAPHCEEAAERARLNKKRRGELQRALREMERREAQLLPPPPPPPPPPPQSAQERALVTMAAMVRRAELNVVADMAREEKQPGSGSWGELKTVAQMTPRPCAPERGTRARALRRRAPMMFTRRATRAVVAIKRPRPAHAPRRMCASRVVAGTCSLASS